MRRNTQINKGGKPKWQEDQGEGVAQLDYDVQDVCENGTQKVVRYGKLDANAAFQREGAGSPAVERWHLKWREQNLNVGK